MRNISLFILIGFLLMGCQPQAPQPTIFDTSPCKAPCWQNVTPGVTSKEDALLVFKQFADKKGILFQHYPPGTFYSYDNDLILFFFNDGNFVFASTLKEQVSELHF